MNAHTHIFIPAGKEEVYYCQKCYKLSYKGIIAKTFPINDNNKFNINPLKLKFKPISYNCNFNSQNNLQFLEYKNKGISKIKFLVNSFGLNEMIFYKSICFLNKIFLEKEISINEIDNVSSICVLLVVKYNECCSYKPFVFEEYLTKNELDILYFHSVKNSEAKIKSYSNLPGLFNYIKKKINNYKYWELLCLKYLDYDLGRYSSYDYLILFFKLGIIFSEAEVLLKDKLKICLNILDIIIYDKKFCKFSQYTFAMSIIKLVLENEIYFDKKIFKAIYGVDLSKDKYIKCSNLINNIINKSLYSNFLNNILYYNILNNKEIYPKKYGNVIKENKSKNLNNIGNKIKEEKIDHYNNNEEVSYKYNEFFDSGQFNPFINNKNIIINNNNNIINVNNNFDVKNIFDDNCFHYKDIFCFN